MHASHAFAVNRIENPHKAPPTLAHSLGCCNLVTKNPTLLVLTDRNELDHQRFHTFANAQPLLRQPPVQAKDRQHLQQLLKVKCGAVILTTIQKFHPQEGNVYTTLTTRSDIIVIADEAHRTQYGFSAKNVAVKDAQGNTIGQKTVYGFAKYIRDALPNATYIGFTGTPIEKNDANTPAVFGPYVDIYDIAQAVEDRAIVPIHYESRLAKVSLSEEGKQLIHNLDHTLDPEVTPLTQELQKKWIRLADIIGHKARIKNIAQDIVRHFEARQTVLQGKGMIVAMSRKIAVQLYQAIIAQRPDWHSDDPTQGTLKVIMTASSADGPDMSKHHTTQAQRHDLAHRMKNPHDPLQLVIVRDMWLTGFDVPSMHTLYIDKPMRGHHLMQAIARVNRVYQDKPNGLIVDYLGLFPDLKKALSFYTDSGGKGDPVITQDQAVQQMLAQRNIVTRMFTETPFHTPSQPSPTSQATGYDYNPYFSADTRAKLHIIQDAQEYILSLQDGAKRFIEHVTNLSKAFAIAVPHDQAMALKEEVAFFQTIKKRLS